MSRAIHVCSFSAVDLPRGEALTYESLRDAVLRAGRFSAFEASANQRVADLFTRLCADPEIETDITSVGYPWTLVRRRTGGPA